MLGARLSKRFNAVVGDRGRGSTVQCGVATSNTPFCCFFCSRAVFASHDRTVEEFNQYYATMPWHALPYTQNGRKAAQELVEKYQVGGVPTLVLLRTTNDDANDGGGAVITVDGRALVVKDPEGSTYPFEPKSRKAPGTEEEGDCDCCAAPRTMSSADLKLVRFACEATARCARKAWDHQRVSLVELAK